MNKMFAFGIAAFAAILIWFVLFRSGTLTTEELISLLKENDTEFAEMQPSLVGCQLVINPKAVTMENGLIVEATGKIDLAIFNFRQVRIQSLKEGKTVLVAKRKPQTEKIVAQAFKIAELAPTNGEAWTRTLVRKYTARPEQKIEFKLAALLSPLDGQASDDIPPPEDAPEFYQFAQSVLDLDAPTTAWVVLSYMGEVSIDRFFAGTVAFPAEVRFGAKTVEDAKELTKTLANYQRAVCS
ncbi:MAG: hypothetical protein P1U83_19320 [Roseovarius sp.]|nr:hypothetical protein [Roseovarius sp.]